MSVRNEKNAAVQQLTCPLLRDNAEVTEGELAATREQLVSNFTVREEMELLTNLEPFGNGQISSSHIGPETIWRAVYRVMESEQSRPKRQLIPLSSCLVETQPGGGRPTTVVITHYEKGQPVVQRYEGGKMDIKAALGMCNQSRR